MHRPVCILVLNWQIDFVNSIDCLLLELHKPNFPFGFKRHSYLVKMNLIN